jgi:hypothetical protein
MGKVFLSYSLHDEREAAVIRDALSERGLDVWWDAELPVGKNWAAEVARALDKSDSMVVLVSPTAMKSDLVKRELEHALSSENFRNRIFPVLIKETPPSELPGFFTLMQMFDLTREHGKRVKAVADAIKAAPKGSPRLVDKAGKPVRLVVRTGSAKKDNR